MNQTSRSNNSSRNYSFLSPLKPNYLRWNTFLVLETIFLVATVYMLFSFTFYTIKNVLDKPATAAVTPNRAKIRKTRHHLLGLLIFYTATSASNFSLAQWVYWGAPVAESTQHCAVIALFYQPVHTLGATSLFLFLWLRQHSLLEGFKAITATPGYVIKFSWFLFGTTLLFGTFSFFGLILSNTSKKYLYIKGTNACSYIEANDWNAVLVFASYSFLVVLQGCFLFLFIYVLRRSRKQTYSELKKFNFSSNSATSRGIPKLIRNCTIAAAVSSVSHSTVVTIALMTKGQLAQLIVNGMWDIDNAICLSSIVFCFSNWKELLLPYPCFKNLTKKKSSTSSVPTTPV